MECKYPSPYGRHETEFCSYLGCEGPKILRQAIELYESVEAQLKDPSLLEATEAERTITTIIVP